MAEQHEANARERIMSARVAAWIGTLTNLILSTRIHDPIVSWQYLPEGLIRVSIEIVVSRERHKLSRVFVIEEIGSLIDLTSGAIVEAQGMIDDMKSAINRHYCARCLHHENQICVIGKDREEANRSKYCGSVIPRGQSKP